MASGTRSHANLTAGTASPDSAASSASAPNAASSASATTSSTMPPHRLHLPPPPPFTGTGQEPEAWLSTLRRVGPAQGWRPEDDTLVIPALLTGIAAVWYDQLDDATKSDASALRKALVSAFGRSGGAASAREELHLRRQRPSESVTELAVAVGDLCYRADPKMTAADRVQHFVQACNAELRRLLAATLPASVTWDQAVTAAKRIEASGPLSAPIVKAEANAVADGATDLQRRIEALEARFAASPPAAPPAPHRDRPNAAGDRHNSSNTCERCGKFGHTAAVCRALAPRSDRAGAPPPFRHQSSPPSTGYPARPPPHPNNYAQRGQPNARPLNS